MDNRLRSKIFVSSAYVDLREARQIAIKTVLELGHLPIAMEHFPSSSQTSWELIASTVRSADYMILILGGRYGTVAGDGLSFTQREIELAKELRIPILSFVHGAPGDLPAKIQDIDPRSREHLARFRAAICQASNVRFWTAPTELAGQIAIAIVVETANNPRFSLTDSNPEVRGGKNPATALKSQASSRNEHKTEKSADTDQPKVRGLRISLDRRALQSRKISLEALKAELKPPTGGPKTGGEIRVVLELDDRNRILEIDIPGRYDVGPMMQGHLGTLPGVLDVIDL